MTTVFDQLKKNSLMFLDTVRINDITYQFHPRGESNIFSSVLALFIYDLFDIVPDIPLNIKERWAEYILSRQDKESGFFKSETKISERVIRNELQLTTFCLTALHILGREPLYNLPYQDELLSKDFVIEFLNKEGCLDGRRGSGNMAMFIGILMTYLYEKTQTEIYHENLNRWFDIHDKKKNEIGLWGKDTNSYHYKGIQNGFHQLVIYYYHNKPVQDYDKILERILNIQDFEGHFAPILGGMACEDYDAIHILASIAYSNIGSKTDSDKVKEALIAARSALLADMNADGGFCQTKHKIWRISDSQLKFILNSKNIQLAIIRLRKTLGNILRGQKTIKVNWFTDSRSISESNLWDTWFKCLSIAEIEYLLIGERSYRFPEIIGLGNIDHFKVLENNGGGL